MKKEDFLARIKNQRQRAMLPAAEIAHPGLFAGQNVDDESPAALADKFSRELTALSGHAYQFDSRQTAIERVLQILQAHQADHLLAWAAAELSLPGLGAALQSAGITHEPDEILPDGPARAERLKRLASVPVGLTGAQGGLADTGSLALISGPGRGRLASLLPPVHIALLRRERLYPTLADFLTTHSDAAVAGSNLVLITGPSRTADIEMTLSLGVHGPGELHVIIYPG